MVMKLSPPYLIEIRDGFYWVDFLFFILFCILIKLLMGCSQRFLISIRF